MKKAFMIFIPLIFIASMTCGNLLNDVYDDINIEPAIYVGGFSINGSDVQVPGYWKDETWTALTPIDASKDSIVSSIFINME